MVSIIVPVYNASNYLRDCLDSLLGQTYADIEVICVDDGSTDPSLQILQDYSEKDARVRVKTQKNAGVAAARNTGLQYVAGQYVMFVDADDWLDSVTCEAMMSILQEQDADVVMCSYVREYESNSLPKYIFGEDEVVFDEKEVRHRLHRRFIGLIGEELAHPESADALCPVWGKLYKRDIVIREGLTFTDLSEIGTYEDGLFNLEAFLYVKKAVYINETYYHYRKTNDVSLTSKYNPHLLEQWDNLHARMRRYIEENELPEEYWKAYYNRIALSILGIGLNIANRPRSVVAKVKMIKEILAEDQYRKAYSNLELRYFPLHWKVFFGCAKRNLTVGVYVLLLCIKKIIGA